MNLALAALKIRQAQKPKKLKVYRIEGCWVVRNPWTNCTTYNADFAEAMAWMDIELLDRLWTVSMRGDA